LIPIGMRAAGIGGEDATVVVVVVDRAETLRAEVRALVEAAKLEVAGRVEVNADRSVVLQPRPWTPRHRRATDEALHAFQHRALEDARRRKLGPAVQGLVQVTDVRVPAQARRRDRAVGAGV